MSLDNNEFGTLASSTHYWVALIPGAVFHVPPESIGAFGIQWGGTVDSAPDVPAIPIPPGGGNKLFTAVEIGSKSSPDDTLYGCPRGAALLRVRRQEYWSALPRYAASIESTEGRFEAFASRSVIRHGIVIRGTKSS